MGWSITFGRVAGTEVKVHLTFFILVAFWAMAGYQQGGSPGALLATLSLLALFACVVLHEFGHILMARRFGVRTPDVILLPIGGVARLERIPDEPRQELLIALAGPAVTLAIVVVLYLLLAVAGRAPDLWEMEPAGPFLENLMRVNLYLLLFNLFPAFPMDGGRVLRALLASHMGLAAGTRIAARLGQASAVVAGFYGLTAGEPILLLVSLFVFLGAGAEASAVEARVAGAGLNASQMMVTHFRSIPVHASLADAVELLLSGEQREFPVVDNLGQVEGILTRDHIIKGLSQRGAGSTVGEAMAAGAPAVAPTLGFQESLERLRSSGLPALPVVDPSGRLVGLLTMDNITDLLLVRRAGA
jgi:Zn-dependent protease/predicted transcriptional regulator